MKRINAKKLQCFFRKLSLGIGSATIGIFLVGQEHKNIVKAATIEHLTKKEPAQSDLVLPSLKVSNQTKSQKTRSNEVDTDQELDQQRNSSVSSINIKDAEVNYIKVAPVIEFSVKDNNKLMTSSNTNFISNDVVVNGVPQLSTPNTWKNYNNNWYYYGNSGKLNKNKGSWINGNLFYFNNNGAAVKSIWKQGGNDWYYFGNDGHAYKNRFSWMGSNLFYFKSNAAAATKMWKQGINDWYYFGNDGHAYKNKGAWLGNNLFYFKSNAAAITNEWRQGGNDWYYFGNDGHAYRNKFSWLGIDLFYFNLDGSAARKDWKQDNVSWYYFDNNGHAYRNISTSINGALYDFDSVGHASAYNYTTRIVIDNPEDYLNAVNNYGNQFLQNGRNNPNFGVMTEKLTQISAIGMQQNSDLDLSLDTRPINLQSITSAEKIELSNFMIDIVNSVRIQLGLSRWYYDTTVQKLADDIAKYYNEDGQSILSLDHDMHAISKAAREYKIEFYLQNSGEYNMLEDEGGFYPTDDHGMATMGEVKKQIYWNLKQMFFGGTTSENGPFVEMFHAYDLISSDDRAVYGTPNKDGSVPVALSISYLPSDNIASTHYIAVRPGLMGNI